MQYLRLAQIYVLCGLFSYHFSVFLKGINGIPFIYFSISRKGGEIMRTSSFEHIVRLQFNSLMLIVIKNKVKSRNRQLARHSKREVLFCEIAETKQVERGTIDTCFYDCVSFKVLHFTIYVSDETLGTVLHRLSEKQRSAILLRYFQGMNDRKISELYHVSRSAICSRRTRGLRKLKMLLSEGK